MIPQNHRQRNITPRFFYLYFLLFDKKQSIFEDVTKPVRLAAHAMPQIGRVYGLSVFFKSVTDKTRKKITKPFLCKTQQTE